MGKLLKKYTKLRIAEICGVQPKTVHNWFAKNNMPYWAFKKLGYAPYTRKEIQELYHRGYRQGIENRPIIEDLGGFHDE